MGLIHSSWVAGFPGAREPPSQGQALSLLPASELWRGLPTLPQAGLNSLAHLPPGLPTSMGEERSPRGFISSSEPNPQRTGRLPGCRKPRAKKERSQAS